jgi:hypothetical protein
VLRAEQLDTDAVDYGQAIAAGAQQQRRGGATGPELGTNAQGQKVIRFPFLIPGL